MVQLAIHANVRFSSHDVATLTPQSANRLGEVPDQLQLELDISLRPKVEVLPVPYEGSLLVGLGLLQGLQMLETSHIGSKTGLPPGETLHISSSFSLPPPDLTCS